MNEKKLKITPEMLRMLEAIRENCNKIDRCIDCPLHIADDPYNICRLAIGMYPLSWDFTGMEAESDGREVQVLQGLHVCHTVPRNREKAMLRALAICEAGIAEV